MPEKEKLTLSKQDKEPTPEPPKKEPPKKKAKGPDPNYDETIKLLGRPIKVKLRGTAGKAVEYPKLLAIHRYQLVVMTKEGHKRFIYKHAVDYIDEVPKEE